MGNEIPLKARESGLSARKKLVFWLILLSFPFLLLGAVEGSVRLLFTEPKSDDPFLNIGAVPSFFTPIDVNGRPHYLLSHSQTYRYRHTIFPAHKDPSTLRVFCLGSSASAGWPHPKTEIYSAYLQQALQRALPDKTIEVINVSAHAYASYRTRLIFEQVLEFEPDLLVIYAGNNEFLEKRNYVPEWPALQKAADTASSLAVFRLLQYWQKRYLFPDSTLSGWEREHIKYEVWSKVARVALDLRKDPVQLDFVKRHYRFNIESMATDAARRNLPVVLVTVPVNLRDWHPNVSYNALTGAQLDEWKGLFAQGRRALLLEETDQAAGAFRAAIAVEPLHAESHYYLGRALERKGELEAALAEYQQAKELDYNPFRALEDFNLSLRSIAAAMPNVYLADASDAFLRDAQPHAPGFDHFVDYVHPNKRGNLLVARTVFDTVLRERIFGAPSGTGEFSHVPELTESGRPYDERDDPKLQESLLTLYAMMHQYEGLIDLARGYKGSSEQGQWLARRALEVFPNYVELDRKRLLGVEMPADEQERIVQAVMEFYGEKFAKWGGREVSADIF